VPPQIVGPIRYVARMSESDMRDRKKRNPGCRFQLIRATPLFLPDEKAKYFSQAGWTRRANQCRRKSLGRLDT
jgi:hypothetical protein